MNRRVFIQGGLFTLVAGVLSGCYHYGTAGGPPPWAPAHGYRRKHPSGAHLVYDPGLGVYVVAGRPGYYYMDNHFYHLIDGVWRVSVDLGGPWYAADARGLPPGLAKKGGRGGPPGHRKRGR